MSSSNDDVIRLKSAYDQAARALKLCKVNDKGAERNFAIAYQGLVAAGLAMQIKKKYRGN